MQDRFGAYLYILPAFLAIAVVLFFPYGFAIYLSVNKVAPSFSMRFIGFGNFVRALNDRVFWISLRNLLLVVAWSQVCGLTLGLAGALALRRGASWQNVWRVVLLIPWAIPGVVTSLTWLWILDGHFGILNQILRAMAVTRQYVSWIASKQFALGAVVLVNVWRSFSFILVMLLAGLQAIPKELYESAGVDGARPFQQFWNITLPGLSRVLAVTMMLTTIWNFKIFDLVWVLTGGGPGYETEVLSTLIYRSSFSNLDFGYASSTAVLMALVMAIPVALYVRLLRSEG